MTQCTTYALHNSAPAVHNPSDGIIAGCIYINFQFQPPIFFNASTTTMKFIQPLAIAASFAAVAESSLSLPQALLNFASGSDNGAKQPNILFIISDDQDLALGSTEYTPRTVKHIKQKGTFFRNHFVTTALCCPSRVSLWTGRQAHNTNVTDVRPPYGMNCAG